jgi:dihydroorotate dehydrogenase (NAD+) catalytic subunit
MIRFSNGHELTFCNGSGALAFDGRGWWWEFPLRWLGILDPKAFTVVAKTVTVFPREGNLSLWHPWTCVRVLRNSWSTGAVNAVGLTNPGVEHWVNHHYPTAMKKGYKIAASVSPEHDIEASLLANQLMKSRADLAYIEVNLSCPNVKHVPIDIPVMLEKLSYAKHPLVLKLSEDQITPEFIKASEKYVEAYHAINSIPWDNVMPRSHKSPIQKYSHGQKGGVSGEFIFARALDAVAKLKTLTNKPVIGGGGIFHLIDVRCFEQAGAEAFSIGTCFMLRPWKPNRIVRQYQATTK